jgi:hypothetical protein
MSNSIHARLRTLLSGVGAVAILSLASCADETVGTTGAQEAPVDSQPAISAPPDAPIIVDPPRVDEPVEEPLVVPDAPLPPVEIDRDPLEELSVNRNERDGALGSLCWARWEMARYLLLASLPVGDEATKPTPDELSAVARTSLSEVDAVRDKLPSELVPFADALREALQRAVESSDLAAPSTFEFESFPAVEEYVELASSHQSCERP